MPGLPIISYYNRVAEESPTITSSTEHPIYPDDNVAINSHVDIYRSNEQALVLNGTDECAFVDDHDDFDITGDLTIEAMICPGSVSGAQEVVNKMTSASINGYSLQQNGDEIRLRISNESSTSCAVKTSVVNMAVGSWYRLKAVYDASAQEISFYLDGVEIARGDNSSQTGCTLEGTIPAAVPATSVRLTIGANPGDSYPFTGKIATVGIYSGEDDNEEPLNPSDCAGYWKFDGDLTDCSGNGHDLTGVEIDGSNYQYAPEVEQWLKFDFGSAGNIDFAFIPRFHNLTNSATLKVQGNSTDSWSSPPVNETLSVSAGKAIAKCFTGGSYRYWRVLFADASNPDGYLEIPNIWLGEWQDLTTAYGSYSRRSIIPGRGNVSTIHTRKSYQSGARIYGFNMPWELKGADRQIWEAAHIYACTQPIVLALDRDDLDDTSYLVNWLEARLGGSQEGSDLSMDIDVETGGLASVNWTFDEVGAGIDQ